MALDELRQMPSHDVEQTLSDRAAYSAQALRAIAAELGLRIPSKTTRLSLVEKISKTLGNRWGYQYLRGDAPNDQQFDES